MMAQRSISSMVLPISSGIGPPAVMTGLSSTASFASVVEMANGLPASGMGDEDRSILGEDRQVQSTVGVEDDHGFNKIAQLTNVPGPIVCEELANHGW